MIQIGFQPRHLVDKPDDYREFLLHKSLFNQYLTHRLFEVRRPQIEEPKKKSNKK